MSSPPHVTADAESYAHLQVLCLHDIRDPPPNTRRLNSDSVDLLNSRSVDELEKYVQSEGNDDWSARLELALRYVLNLGEG